MGLIKMNLYRLRKSPSSYIILVAFVLFLMMGFALMFAEATGGDSEYSGIANTTSSYFQYFVTGDILAVFVTIISAIFVHSEIANGGMKNIYGKETHKHKFVVSKVAVMLLYVFFILAIAFAVCLAFNYIHDGEISLEVDAIELIRYVLVQSLLLTAFSSTIMCLGTVTRNNMVTLILGIVYCTWGYAFESFIDSKLQEIDTLSDFVLSNYLVMGNLQSIYINSSFDEYLRAIIVAICITTVTTVISSLWLSKSDVK